MTNASVIAPVAQVKWLKNSAISIWKHWNAHTHSERARETESKRTYKRISNLFFSSFFHWEIDFSCSFCEYPWARTHTNGWHEQATSERAGATSGQRGGCEGESTTERTRRNTNQTDDDDSMTKHMHAHNDAWGSPSIHVLWMFLWLFDCCCCCFTLLLCLGAMWVSYTQTQDVSLN